MINKESKQTKKTTTKGLYNTIPSNHSLNKTGDNKQMRNHRIEQIKQMQKDGLTDTEICDSEQNLLEKGEY